MEVLKTTAESYYDWLGNTGAGTLFYLTRRTDTEFVFEPIIIDTKKKDLTIKILQRVMNSPNFIALPGTPEMDEFINTDSVASLKKK